MSAFQIDSEIPGKKKNCGQWAEYEPPHSSATSRLCHGGWFDGEEYSPCPVRAECKAATMGETRSEPRRLPLLNPGQMPMSRPALSQPQPFRALPTTLPTTQAAAQKYGYNESYGPRPVIPPPEYPAVMRTPYVPSSEFGTPTFLPEGNEGTFERLAKNMLQSAIAAAAWQIFNYLRSTDLFKIT